MTTFTILTPPAGSTAQQELATLNPNDPTYANADLMDDIVAVGAVYAATQGDAVGQIKLDIQTSTNAVNLDTAAAQLWSLREQIMEASWPSDPTWQAKLITDLNADAAVPVPAAALQPPPATSTASYTVDDVTAAETRAQTILNDLQAAQQDSTTSGQPMEQFLASSNGDLLSAVGGWLTAQGVDYGSDSWNTTLLKTGSTYTSVDKSSLTTPWTIASPAVMYMGDAPAPGGLWYHDPGGSVYPISLLSIGTMTANQLGSLEPPVDGGPISQYDLSLLPAAVRNDATAMNTQAPYVYFQDAEGVKHVLLDPSTATDPSVAPPLKWPVSGDPAYQDIIPSQARVGVDAGSNQRYWSDGTNLYLLDFTDPQYLADVLGATGTYPTGGNLVSQMLDNASQFGPEVQKVQRLPSSGDVSAIISTAKTNVQTLDNATDNWTALGQSQLVELQEKISDYGNGVNWVTDAQERLEHVLMTWDQDL